jgi:amino acid adenylation domain-containing protein/FkbM family methyltransferase
MNDDSLCLHELIEEQARRTPAQPAIVFEQQMLTYAELERRAGLLANRLTQLGAGPDRIVGLSVDRSLEMIVGILGILKAGAAYLPIDPDYPRERVEFILRDAGVTLLVARGGEKLRADGVGPLSSIDLDAFDWSQSPVSGNKTVRPPNLAYVIYTSGSTGLPKGVCIEHRNIVSYVLSITERLQLEPGMTYATVSTIAADLGNTVIFPALTSGGCLHVISQERVENPTLLSAYFQRERIDVLKIVPSHLAALQSSGNPEHVMPRRRLVLGGEASRLDWVEHLETLSLDCEIYNHYGPTETTVGVLTYKVGPELPAQASRTLPLGVPLPNSRVYILDSEGKSVPPGEQGELYIGGAGVARGYLNRDDLTAAKFVPDLFGSGRLYRTGDLARQLPDGNFQFCGRIDDQIKLRGYRVELGEVEAVMAQHPGVKQAVSLAPEGRDGNRQLVAYVVPKRQRQPLWNAGSVCVLPDGSSAAHLNKNETDYIYNEIFVLQAYLRHGITINDGDCIVDAGANIGLFTVFAGRLARNLRITSFEPNPDAFACLKANAEAWGEAVKCLPIGLSHENKSAKLTLFQGLSLLSGFYADVATEREVVKSYVLNKDSASSNDERLSGEIEELIDSRLQTKSVSVQLRTLSTVMADEGIDRIDLLKINVEKSELDVLLGIDASDWPKIRQLVIEVDQRQHLDPILALLKNNGFEVIVEQDPLLRNTDLCYVYAIRPTAVGSLIREQPASDHLRALPPVDDEILTPAALRRYLKARLPQYMIPSRFVLIERLPLTSNGKIDRHSLPSDATDPGVPSQDFLRPTKQTESSLVAIWSELLNVGSLSINDDFFDLGGHSLLAMRLVSRIREVFDVDLSLRHLVERPTVSRLAEAIDGLACVMKRKEKFEVNGNREEIAL